MLTPHLIFLFIIQNHFSLFVLTVVAPDELFPGTVCVCLCVWPAPYGFMAPGGFGLISVHFLPS